MCDYGSLCVSVVVWLFGCVWYMSLYMCVCVMALLCHELCSGGTSGVAYKVAGQPIFPCVRNERPSVRSWEGGRGGDRAERKTSFSPLFLLLEQFLISEWTLGHLG